MSGVSHAQVTSASGEPFDRQLTAMYDEESRAELARDGGDQRATPRTRVTSQHEYRELSAPA